MECIDFEKSQKADEILTSSKELIDDTIDEMRNMSNNLLPNVLLEFGLIQALKQMLNYCSKREELRLNFKNELKNELILNQKDEIQIYRIMQEAFKNAISHSAASQIELIISENALTYQFIIKDNGKGFDPDNKKAYGNGLYNIKERVNLINAEIEIKTSMKQGTEIIIFKRKSDD